MTDLYLSEVVCHRQSGIQNALLNCLDSRGVTLNFVCCEIMSLIECDFFGELKIILMELVDTDLMLKISPYCLKSADISESVMLDGIFDRLMPQK